MTSHRLRTTQVKALSTSSQMKVVVAKITKSIRLVVGWLKRKWSSSISNRRIQLLSQISIINVITEIKRILLQPKVFSVLLRNFKHWLIMKLQDLLWSKKNLNHPHKLPSKSRERAAEKMTDCSQIQYSCVSVHIYFITISRICHFVSLSRVFAD